MANLNIVDLELARVEESWSEVTAEVDNALATATHAAEVGLRHVITKVEAAYETSATSGLLTIKFGTAVVARKYIHGAGALDFGDPGFINPTANQAVSAELAASGTAGVTAVISLFGFTVRS